MRRHFSGNSLVDVSGFEQSLLFNRIPMPQDGLWLVDGSRGVRLFFKCVRQLLWITLNKIWEGGIYSMYKKWVGHVLPMYNETYAPGWVINRSDGIYLLAPGPCTLLLLLLFPLRIPCLLCAAAVVCILLSAGPPWFHTARRTQQQSTEGTRTKDRHIYTRGSFHKTWQC